MLESIRELWHDAGKHVEIYFLGPMWGWLHEYYLSGLFFASPYVWISLFWGLNWIIGSALALAQPAPQPGEPDLRWNPRRSLQSVTKLLIWILGLLVATGLRKGLPVTGGWLPAGIIEVAVLLTEGSYLLRNLGRVATKLGNRQQGALLGLVADRTEEFMDSQVHVRTVVTVQETTTTTDLCPVAREHRPANCPSLIEPEEKGPK